MQWRQPPQPRSDEGAARQSKPGCAAGRMTDMSATAAAARRAPACGFRSFFGRPGPRSPFAPTAGRSNAGPRLSWTRWPRVITRYKARPVGGPAWTWTGARSSGSIASRRTRPIGSKRRTPAAKPISRRFPDDLSPQGRDDRRAPRRVSASAPAAPEGFRSRRRDRQHWPPKRAANPGGRRQRRPATCCRWSATSQSRYGCSTSDAGPDQRGR